MGTVTRSMETTLMPSLARDRAEQAITSSATYKAFGFRYEGDGLWLAHRAGGQNGSAIRLRVKRKGEGSVVQVSVGTVRMAVVNPFRGVLGAVAKVLPPPEVNPLAHLPPPPSTPLPPPPPVAD